MGKEYKRRHKELLGKPSVQAYDVLQTTVTSVSGITAHTTAGGDGANYFVMPRDGLLDCWVVNASPALTAGTLSFALHKNGSVVHSGDLSSAKPSLLEKFWHTETNNEVTVASGDVVQVHYAISSVLSPGATARSATSRVCVRYRES